MIGILPLPLNANKETIPDFLVGSNVASREFVHNALRFLPAQSIGLFVHETDVGPAWRDLARLDGNEGGNFRTARVCGINAIPAALQTQSITALHGINPLQIHQLSYLRSQFAPRPFPITALTHGFSYQNLLWELFTRLWLTPTLPCDSVVCSSNAARQAFHNSLEQAREGLREAGASGATEKEIRLDVIPLGVDVELFRPRDKADARRILGLPLRKTMLLYFGRMDAASKGDLAPLLFTFRELVAKHGENLVLVLAGNLPDHAVGHLQRAIDASGCTGQVLVRRQPALTEGPLYYAAADVFVSPVETLQESFGLTPLEAMASGLPVVVSDWSGYKETVAHGETGFRVPTLWAACDRETALLAPLHSWEEDHLRLAQSVAVDSVEMFKHLDALIANPEQRAVMGQKAREHVVANFSWERVMARWLALWRELAEVARSLPSQEPACQHLEQPQYFRNFGHFASRCLDGSECLAITERGRQASRQPDAILLPLGMQGVLHPRALLVLLRFARTMSFFKQRVTVGELCERIAPRCALTASAALAHVLWLIKQGLLQVNVAPAPT